MRRKYWYMVELESSEYGSESFEYDTLGEQKKAVARLSKAAADKSAADGIERHVFTYRLARETQEIV